MDYTVFDPTCPFSPDTPSHPSRRASFHVPPLARLHLGQWPHGMGSRVDDRNRLSTANQADSRGALFCMPRGIETGSRTPSRHHPIHAEHQGGSILISGNAAGSPLYQRITSSDPDSRMPPEGQPLTQDQIALISQWIDRGIQAIDNEQPQADPRQHWAFQPIRKPRLDLLEHPASDEQPVVHPIDQLLQPMQQQMNVQPWAKPIDRP